MHQHHSDRMNASSSQPADVKAVERRLRREAQSITEPSDEARVAAVMARVRQTAMDAPSAASWRHRPSWRYAGVGLAAACVLVGVFVGVSWLSSEPASTPIAVQPDARPGPEAGPEPSAVAGADELIDFPDLRQTGRLAHAWAALEMEAEWRNLRMDAARFAGPLAFGAGATIDESDIAAP